jgi:hypothetical protein
LVDDDGEGDLIGTGRIFPVCAPEARHRNRSPRRHAILYLRPDLSVGRRSEDSLFLSQSELADGRSPCSGHSNIVVIVVVVNIMLAIPSLAQ